jgi:hypothetical protein
MLPGGAPSMHQMGGGMPSALCRAWRAGDADGALLLSDATFTEGTRDIHVGGSVWWGGMHAGGSLPHMLTGWAQRG